MNSAVVALLLTAVITVSSIGTAEYVSTAADNKLRRLPIYCVCTDEKKIAVTFDAAWSADDTDELITILKTYNAKATFFAVGDWVDKNPEAVKKLYTAGHEIGNHSNTHAAFSKIDRSEILKEITECNKKIEAVTGEKVTLVRAPSGDYDNKSIEVTESLGMKMIQWSADSLDWKKLSVAEMTSRIMNKAEPGAILLFHNGVENTPAALESILKLLTEKGFSFVTVSELIYKDNFTIDRAGKQIKR